MTEWPEETRQVSSNSQFLDSPSAKCERIGHGDKLSCQSFVVWAVYGKKKVLLTLPYSEELHSLSTDGKKNDR